MKEYKASPEDMGYSSEEEMKKFKVLVGMPCYGGNLTTEACQGLIRIGQRSVDIDVFAEFYFVTNESLVCRARNLIVAHFLSSIKDYTHLMFIDADTKFNGDDVFKMLHYNKDWVAGAVAVKTLPIRHVIDIELKDNIANITEDKKLVELSNMGGAFNLIKRRVFEQMIEAYPELHSDRRDVESEFFASMVPSDEKTGRSGMKEYQKKILNNFYALYDTGLSEPLGLLSEKDRKNAIEQGRTPNAYLSEDFTFAKRWKKIGGKIWLDPRIPLGHIGRYTYEGNAMENFPKEFWLPSDYIVD